MGATENEDHHLLQKASLTSSGYAGNSFVQESRFHASLEVPSNTGLVLNLIFSATNYGVQTSKIIF